MIMSMAPGTIGIVGTSGSIEEARWLLNEVYGTEAFLGDIPQIILDLVRRTIG